MGAETKVPAAQKLVFLQEHCVQRQVLQPAFSERDFSYDDCVVPREGAVSGNKSLGHVKQPGHNSCKIT